MNKQNKKLAKTNEVSFSNMEKLTLISKIIVIGLLFAVFFHFIYQGMILKKDYPYNTFLFLPSDRFMDFINMVNICKNRNPYFEPYYLGNSNYLPIANIIFWAFSFIKVKSLLLFSYFLLASTAIYYLIYLFLKQVVLSKSVHIYTFILSFLTYGYIINIDRGNLELYVFVFTLLFTFCYIKQKTQLSILFLSIAVAMKIFPILFLLLFIADKKYKEIFYVILLSVLLILIPIFFQNGGYLNNLNLILVGFEMELHSSIFLALEDKNNFMLQGTSLFSAFKLIDIKFNLATNHLLMKYIVIVAVIFIFFAFYIVFIEKVLWRKFTLIISMFIFLPHLSSDYKLIHLTICVLLFLNEAKGDNNSTLNYKKIAIIFGVLLIPKFYIYFQKIISTSSGKNDISINTLISPILMLYLCYLIINNGVKSSTKEKISLEIQAQFLAIKKSMVYILPIILLIIPYYLFSKKAKANYVIYKTHYLKAQDLVQNNKTIEALPELKESFHLKPHKFLLPLQIANIYNTANQPDSSKLYFSKVLQIYPECQEAIQGLLIQDINKFNSSGIQALNNKEFSKAEVYFKDALYIFLKMPPNPQNMQFLIGLYSNITVSQINQQKWTDAQNIMKQIVAIDPNNEFVKSNTNYINQMMATQSIK